MDLGKTIRKWVSILRLRDWTIRYRYVHPDEIDGSDGRVYVDLKTKTADIKVSDDTSRGPMHFRGRDIEADVVHELMHLHLETFFPADRDSLAYTMAEQATDEIAKAFIALDRRKPRG